MVDTDPRLPSWETFISLVRSGVPSLQPIPGVPPLQLFVDEGGGRIGMQARVDRAELSGLPTLDYADIKLRWIDRSGDPHLELSTQATELFHEFFSLLLVAADLIQQEKRDPVDAVMVSLRRWRQLLAPADVLSEDAQVGLFGELWLLRRLITAHGPPALEQWVGPRDEPHDFRLGHEEIEVKTTRASKRVHTINSLQQLEPWPNRPLYVLSLQLGLAGGATGDSVPDLVAAIRLLLAGDHSRLQALTFLLETGAGYSSRHEAQYGTRYQIRTPPVLVPVDEQCPRITTPTLDGLAADVKARLDFISYRVNLEGLGFGEGSPVFSRLIP